MSISLTIAKCWNINHKTHLIIDSSFTLIKIMHYMVDTSFGTWFNMGFYVIFYNLYSYRMVRAEKPEDKMRARRTNIMLFTISMVFCVAWLPLNLIGILLDQIKLFGDNIELAYLTYVACHLVCIYSKIIIKVTFSHMMYCHSTKILCNINFSMILFKLCSLWNNEFLTVRSDFLCYKNQISVY